MAVKITLKETIHNIKANAFRRGPHKTTKQKIILFFRCLFESQYGILFWFRVTKYLHHRKTLITWLLFCPSFVIYRILQHWTGIQFPVGTTIGEGAKISHYSAIVLASSVIIGKGVTLLQGVTIGRGYGKKNPSCPVIGNNVVIFAGAKLFGNIHVGDNVIIGANSVVNTDIPSNSIVAGIPAKVISNNIEDAIEDNWKQSFYGY